MTLVISSYFSANQPGPYAGTCALVLEENASTMSWPQPRRSLELMSAAPNRANYGFGTEQSVDNESSSDGVAIDEPHSHFYLARRYFLSVWEQKPRS